MAELDLPTVACDVSVSLRSLFFVFLSLSLKVSSEVRGVWVTEKET